MRLLSRCHTRSQPKIIRRPEEIICALSLSQSRQPKARLFGRDLSLGNRGKRMGNACGQR